MPEQAPGPDPADVPGDSVADDYRIADAGAAPSGGRQRLWRAFLRPRRGQVVVAALLAVVGFAAITQVRTSEDADSYAGYREQDLIDVLAGLTGTTQRAQAELARLEAARDRLQSDTQARQAALEEAQKQVDTLDILAGLVPVTGPGIRVKIEERTSEVNVDTFIDLIQELRTNHAEAMQINGEVRLVAQTSFEQVGGGLVVDGKLLEPPYVLDVIGEPGALEAAVTFVRGPQYELENDGAHVDVTQLTSLDITTVVSTG